MWLLQLTINIVLKIFLRFETLQYAWTEIRQNYTFKWLICFKIGKSNVNFYVLKSIFGKETSVGIVLTCNLKFVC